MPVVSELTPTGIDLVNAPGVESMVVDGTGAVWLHGPWQLTRVDPATGAARTWDVADDVVFATVRSIGPSGNGGVWLVEPNACGCSTAGASCAISPFRRRIAVARLAGSTAWSRSEPEVWVSSVAGVARSAGGAWSLVGDDTITGAAMLTVDTEGDRVVRRSGPALRRRSWNRR